MSNPARIPYLGEIIHFTPSSTPPIRCQAALVIDPRPCADEIPAPPPPPALCRITLAAFDPLASSPTHLPLIPHDESRTPGTWHFAH